MPHNGSTVFVGTAAFAALSRPLLAKQFPQVDWLSHDAGHLFEMMIGNGGKQVLVDDPSGNAVRAVRALAQLTGSRAVPR